MKKTATIVSATLGEKRAPARAVLPNQDHSKALESSGSRRLILADNSTQNHRPRGRPFQKGVSGNPAGKPKGTRNRASAMLEAIDDDDLRAIVSKIVEKAKAGDLVAAKLIFDRVAPAPKRRTVGIDLHAIDKWDGNEAVLSAHRAIVEAVAGGEISPEEALELIAVIEAQRAVVERLRPAAMNREPTPEELLEKKKRDKEAAEAWERCRLKF
jgi:hypothetical protein